MVAVHWRQYVRPQDFVWLLLFSALAIFNPDRTALVVVLLIGLGLIQVIEPRIGPRISVLLKLILCYLLIGFSGGVTSSFYLVLLLPVISASTAFGLLGAIVTSIAACGMYLSFLIFLDFQNVYIPDDEVMELILRSIFLPVVGYLTYELARDTRVEKENAQRVARDLEEANRGLKNAESEIRRADRLAALGQLTAGLAHELRNPLGTMKTSAEMLQNNVSGENEIAKEMAGYITEEVDRTNSLISRFLDFARPQHLKKVPVELPSMLDSAVKRFEQEKKALKLDVTVLKNFSPDVPPISIDSELMERVIVNLLVNAAQASVPGSVVTIKTHSSASEAEIDIIDRGSGIAPKDLENIFNPFFTTKPAGTGLGLAIVSKIVNDHGGRILVESAPGEGSVFRILLPFRGE